MRVGEKETSEQAAIVARYADLFTREQLEALREAEAATTDVARESIARLRLTCQDGIVTRELAEQEDALENALLGARVPWDGDELPLRSAQARLALEPEYTRRDALGDAVLAVSTTFDEERRALLVARDGLESDVSGIVDPVTRQEDVKQVSLRPILDAVDRARVESTPAFTPERERWFDRLLGPEREETPTSAHMAWIRRLSPLEAVYSKERSVPVCLATLARLGFDLEAEPGIRTDLEDRPQKSPRACVIASDPPRVVHLITRAQGGLHDYGAFLHEAGHALHYAGCDPVLPLSFRRLSRDHALTEIYSFLLDSIMCEPDWHAEHFALDDGEAEENAAAAQFSNTILFRRYSAKLGYELRLLVALSHRGPDAGRVRGAPHGRDRGALPRREPPLRHGRRLLLRGLPPRLDPRGAGPRVSPPRDRRGLVAQRRHGRLPARPLRRGHAADDRGGRRAPRVRAARHRRARRGPDGRQRPLDAREQASANSPADLTSQSSRSEAMLDRIRSDTYKTPESGLRLTRTRPMEDT